MKQIDKLPYNFRYPETRKDVSVKDSYHGIEISDPYRWLEDDRSPETLKWVQAQNEFTFDYLKSLNSRSKFLQRLTRLWDYSKYSNPTKVEDKYYFFKNDGLQNQACLYCVDYIDGPETLILDPNTFSKDGTTSLGEVSFNKGGDLLAYSVSEGGSDWKSIYILDLSSMDLLEDCINWVKFSSISWYEDGFFYSSYPMPESNEKYSGKNEFHKVYYHKLGDEQSKDVLILSDDQHPQRNFYCRTTDDEKYLVVSVVESTSGNAIFIKDLELNCPIIKVVENFDFDYSFIDNVGNTLYFLTNEKASNQKLISINIKDANNIVFQTIIEETDHYLRNCDFIGNRIFASYTVNVKSEIEVYDLTGNHISDLVLPGIGTVSAIAGKMKDKIGFFSFTSFIYPSVIFKLDIDTLCFETFRASEIDFNVDDYLTSQKWYPSKDGTLIPMFITHKKDIKLNGENPTLLYGYGGFNVSVLPGFSISRLPLLENGGIYVVANIRGGGEFGKKWHEAGILENKQNVFDDFICAAEFLIAEGYTNSEKLAIEGGSNGGLLVGACIAQRPELFKVALPAVGVLDMLRYHKFTIGWAWATDYGKSENAKDFEYLIKYSPLHNIKNIKYPATLVTTADHDDRVVPAHSFKFIATLQSFNSGDNPVLIRIETSAGHGSGKATIKVIEEAADKLSFMFENMGMALD